MADFKGITESYAIKQKHEFQKQLFWPNLKNGPFNKLEDPVCCIKYCQGSLPNFAMASGFQVEIRDPFANNAVLKTFHRFKSPVRSLAYRNTGSLIAIGEASGRVSVYSVAMRTELRHWGGGGGGGHLAPVSGLAFLAGGASPRVVSCAEDGRCLLWDVADPQGHPLTEFRLPCTDIGESGSGEIDQLSATAAATSVVDKATALDASQTDCNLLVCGMSNGRVALIDTRQATPALVVNAECPVSAVRLAPGDNALYIAGDCWVRAVSLHQGGRQIAAYRRHHKLVTDLAVARGALLSCGLDGMVKVTDLLTFDEVHKYEYPNCGLLCMAIAAGGLNDHHHQQQQQQQQRHLLAGDSQATSCCLALGTSDHWLLTRRFEDPAIAAAANADVAKSSSSASTDAYLKLVRADRPMPRRPEDSVATSVDSLRRRHLQPVDKLLKSFRHSDALSRVVASGYLKRKPHTVAALVRELTRRGALATALAGRGDDEVARLLKFVLHSLGDQAMAPDALPLAWDLVDLYASELHARPRLRPLFERLQALLSREVGLCRDIMGSLGRIDLVLGGTNACVASGSGGSGSAAL